MSSFAQSIFIYGGNFQRIWLGLVRHNRHCNVGRVPRLGLARGPSAKKERPMGPSPAAGIDLGSCHLGNCTVWKLPLLKIPVGTYRLENTLGKLPFGEMTLEKYLTSINIFYSWSNWMKFLRESMRTPTSKYPALATKLKK